MIFHIIGIVFPIFAIVIVGFLYARWNLPDMRVANKINLDIFVPALIFSVLSQENFHIVDFHMLALGGLLIILGSGLIAWIVAIFFGFDSRTFIPPIMFSNSGNIGLPLAAFAFGKIAVPTAVVLFLIENLSHFTIGVWILDKKPNFWRTLSIPIVWSSIAGVTFSFLEWSLWSPLAQTIELLGQISIPLLLFALGVRLISVNLKDWRLGLLGAIICPLSGLIVVCIVLNFLQLDDLQTNQLIIFSVLPPAVLNYMMAERYKQEPDRVASIVMLGNLASVIIIPTTLYFLL